MKQDRVLALLGLAQRAGKVKSGGFMTESSIKEYKAYLVIVANDASDNTYKDFKNMCSFYDAPFRRYGTKEELGHAIGKDMRSSLAVTDEGLAKEIIGKIDGGSLDGKN